MFDFGPTTWVVWGWVNSQFATVLDVCFLPSFLSFLFSSARRPVAPADESSPIYD